MGAMRYVGIPVAVYLLVPFVAGCVIYTTSACKKSVRLQVFPVANTATHLLFSVLLVAGLLAEQAWLVLVAIVTYIAKSFAMSFLTKEVKYAANARTEQSTQSFLQRVRQTRPAVSIFVSCWHTEVYYSTSAHMDSNGHRHLEHEKKTRDVTTYTETRHVRITGWYDQTPPLALQENYRGARVVSLELNQNFDYHQGSRQIVDMMVADAYNQNRHRDARCSVSLQCTVPGLTQYNYLCTTLPLFMQRWFIIVAIFLAFDCPLLLLTRARTPYCALAVRKVISLLPRQPQDAGALHMPSQQPVAPPGYSCNVNDIQPPVMLMENNQPLFSDIAAMPAPAPAPTIARQQLVV